jgi:hypothetical protein
MAIASISNQNNNTSEERLSVLLSIVITAQNNAIEIADCLKQITSLAGALVSDYEIIVVDNGSSDGTLDLLHRLTADDGLPNLQIFSLASAVDAITAQWVGIENSLGDLVVCLDWQQGDLDFFEAIIQKAGEGYDLVFTKRLPIPSRRKSLRHSLYQFFVLATRLSTGLALNAYSTSFIVMSCCSFPIPRSSSAIWPGRRDSDAPAWTSSPAQPMSGISTSNRASREASS